MDASPETGDFTRLLYTSAVDIPVRTHVLVITPLLTNVQCAFLREVKQKGNTIELYLIGGDTAAPRELLTTEFPCFVVSEYGNELIDH
jgi:hypothetical protein